MRKGIRSRLAVFILVVWTLLPLVWGFRIASSLPVDIAAFPPKFVPSQPTIASFVTILGKSFTLPSGEVLLPAGRSGQIIRGFANSLFTSLVVTIITMVVVIPVSYTFGRLEFPQKNKLFFAVLFSVALPPISIILPFYILYVRLGLVGTRIGLILVTLTVTIPMVTWMTIGFFKNLPRVEGLARMDGFSRMGTLFKIILPMGKSGIAVASIISFIFAWNEFTFSQILVNGSKASTIPPVISGFLFMHPEVPSLMATIFYSLIPPFLVAYLLQGHVTSMNLVDPIGG